jgi:hydroxymethylglutaryl-CoA lyase
VITNKSVNVIEVGPRDGFQNIKKYIPLQEKLKIIDDIISSGVKHIELTSFVSPKAIPQLKDAKELTKICLERYPNIDFFPLVPNLYGAKTAYELGLRKVTYVVSLSKSHNKANINRTHKESFEELKRITESYPDMAIYLDLATTFGCPFEGKFKTEEIVNFLKDYVELGVNDIALCDTIGIANPKQVREVINAVKGTFSNVELQVHIHDTRNMGMVNTLAAIECGVKNIQSTLGGLGGCPFAPGASGNLATEDIVFMLNEMGYSTGIDFDKLLEASIYEKTVIDGIYSGHQININNLCFEKQ